MNQFRTLQELEDILGQSVSESERLLAVSERLSRIKKASRKELDEFNKDFQSLLELQESVWGIENLASIQKLRPLTPSEESKKNQLKKNILTINSNVIRSSVIKDKVLLSECRRLIDQEEINDAYKGLDMLESIYGAIPDGTKLSAYFEIFNKIAIYYNSIRSSEVNFLKVQTGRDFTEEEMLSLCNNIWKQFSPQLNPKNSRKVRWDKEFGTPDFKIRKNFNESINTVKDFFNSVHPEIGAIAHEILMPENIHKTKDVSSLYMIYAYNYRPQLVINPSTYFEDEIGIVHELAHGIHHTLKGMNNSILEIDQNNLTLETFSLLFELMFIHNQFLKAPSKQRANSIRKYMSKYLTSMFYERAFYCEFESNFLVNIGNKIKNEKDTSKIYLKIWKKYFGNKCIPEKAQAEGWKNYHSMPSPHLNFVYLLTVFYAVDLFLKHLTYELNGDQILNLLKRGDSFSIEELISLDDIIQGDDKYIERILKIITEFNRGK